MPDKKNTQPEYKEVRNTMIGCLVAILAFHFAWGWLVFKHGFVFYLIDVPLLATFGFTALMAVKNSGDPGRDWTRYLAIAVAAALCVWSGMWNSELLSNMQQFPNYYK